MKAADTVYALMKNHEGYLTAREARENGVSNLTLARLAERGLIERAAYGLYIGPDVFPDLFRIAQYRCPKGVFSHETALFLHGLSDRDPLRLMMTIPSGWNSQMLTNENFLFFYGNPKTMALGACEMETHSGANVRTYDVERTLCDCLKSIDRLDRDLVLTALRRYVKSNGRNNAKMLEYASALKIRDVAYRYLEVLV